MDQTRNESFVSAAPGRAALALGAVCDYLSLSKSGVLTLLLVSTVSSMIIASEGRVSLTLVLWMLAGGSLLAASAGTINCLWDRDIDALMERTKDRPLPAGRISVFRAAAFAAAAGAAGVYVLLRHCGAGPAVFALGGHLIYVLVYTVWLKRRTELNIVIGGAAGAAPVLSGWAATGQITATAWLLSLLIIVWTPPHFWSLAILRRREYSRAGIPMMPSVRGERYTVDQMMFYALLTLPIGVSAALTHPGLGLLSLGAAFFLPLFFCREVGAMRPMAAGRAVSHAQARRAFRWSIIYLSVFFAALVADVLLV